MVLYAGVMLYQVSNDVQFSVRELYMLDIVVFGIGSELEWEEMAA